MKRKLLFITTIVSGILVSGIFTSCEGPMGPQGPQGEPGEGINWKVYDMTIPADEWQLVGGENELNSFYMYIFEGNEAPAELQYVTQYDGDVSGYFISTLDNGDELYSPLPYEVYAGAAGNSGEWLWSELYTFDFTHNSIAFYVYYNDFATSERPGTMKFRMSFKW